MYRFKFLSFVDKEKEKEEESGESIDLNWGMIPMTGRFFIVFKWDMVALKVLLIASGHEGYLFGVTFVFTSFCTSAIDSVEREYMMCLLLEL